MSLNLNLFNTLTNQKGIFEPLDASNIRMYVCGPTVYDRPHLGNARAVVVYDILFRLLRYIYGEDKVTYVRNITDVDDKINKAAKENNESIKQLTDRITKWFHDDMEALNNLAPTKEPTATGHITEIIGLIRKILENGHGYIAKDHVLFDVGSLEKIKDYKYGMLSGKIADDLIAGARIEVENYKRNPQDFVLWKPADKDDDISSVFDSPWGKGRPGWHIECSAMSTSHLGENFDIHGGGADLKFPHHENEVAQSISANPKSRYAKYWVHNGFLTVNGEKMSKSLGNYTTVCDLLDKGVKGETIRLALLWAHYRKPLDFSEKLLSDSKKTLDKFYVALKTADENDKAGKISEPEDAQVINNIATRTKDAFKQFLDALMDDMNTPLALSHLYNVARGIRSLNATDDNLKLFRVASRLLGICQMDPRKWFGTKRADVDAAYIEKMIDLRKAAKQNKNYAEADKIRAELEGQGIILKDTRDGTEWEVKV